MAASPLLPTALLFAVPFVLSFLFYLRFSADARRWLFAVVWELNGASACDAKTKQAKQEIFAQRPLTGRVLDVGSGEGVNLQYLAAEDVTEIVCVEPNTYFHRKLRERARQAVEERRARRGKPLSVRIFAGTLSEYAESAEALSLFDCVTCILVLCSVGDLRHDCRLAARLLKPDGSALYYLEHVAGSGLMLRTAQRLIQPLWNLLGDGCQLCRCTGHELHSLRGVASHTERRFSLLGGLLPVVCGVCRFASGTGPDGWGVEHARQERAARVTRRERARSPARRRPGQWWEVTSNRNVVVVVAR